jgi:hypothetical protein
MFEHPRPPSPLEELAQRAHREEIEIALGARRQARAVERRADLRRLNAAAIPAPANDNERIDHGA